MNATTFFEAVRENKIDAVKRGLRESPELLTTFDGNDQPIHLAARFGHADMIGALIDAGADKQAKNGYGWRPIVFAAYNNRVDALQRLIDAGADITWDGGNPIHYSGQNRHVEASRLLVEHGAIDPTVDSDDPDVLATFRAAYAYDAETLKELLARRPELANARDKSQRTPLHESATGGALAVVQALIGAGADVNAKNEEDETPVMQSAVHGHEDVTRALIDAGATVDIYVATKFNMLDDARRLLEEDASLAQATQYDHPMTDWVAEAGFSEMGRLLAEYGAEIDIHAAASFGMLDRVAELLDANPNLVHETRPMGAYAPLHAAAECGHLDVVKALIERGADVNKRNMWGFRPLHLSVLAARGFAPTEAHLEITRLLIEHGAEVGAKDDYERTPLSLAEGHWEKGDVEHAIIELLRSHGAE